MSDFSAIIFNLFFNFKFEFKLSWSDDDGLIDYYLIFLTYVVIFSNSSIEGNDEPNSS